MPENRSVVGYGGIRLTRNMDLATVRISMRALGQRGAGLLSGTVEGRTDAPQTEWQPAELVVRQTGGPCAANSSLDNAEPPLGAGRRRMVRRGGGEAGQAARVRWRRGVFG